MGSHSRSRCCSRFAFNFRTLSNKGCAGMPGARCTRGLVCKYHKENAHEHTGPPKSPGIPARNGFTDYHVLSLVHGLYGHRRPRLLHRRLDTSVAVPGPHAFSVRLGKSSSQRQPSTSITAHPASMTLRNAPLGQVGWREI